MTRRQWIEELANVAVPERAAISPDGGRIAYVLRTADVDADRVATSIWQVGTRDGAPRRLTRAPFYAAPASSSDGTAIAFRRGRDEQAQLWLLTDTCGEAEQLTTLP